MLKVLLYGTMGDIGPTVRDDLARSGVDAVLVDFPQNTFRDEWGYRRGLGKALAAFRPEVVIPIGHPMAMARFREVVSSGRHWGDVGSDGDGLTRNLRGSAGNSGMMPKILVESSVKISLLDSKVRCSEFVAGLGIPQPRIFTRPEDSVPGEVIFKRDSSFGGCGVLRPKTLQGLYNLIEHEAGRPYLIQEYVHGEDLSVDCLRFGSSFKAGCYVSLRKNQGQGPSVERRTVFCPEAVGYARRILDALDYNGICGMDFRLADCSAAGSSLGVREGLGSGSSLDVREELGAGSTWRGPINRTDPEVPSLLGTLLFLECNPRFCGGLSTQIDSGFDIPLELLRLSGVI